MVTPKTKTGRQRPSARGRRTRDDVLTTAFMFTSGAEFSKAAKDFKFPFSGEASKVIGKKPSQLKTVLKKYGEAVAKSTSAGHSVSFHVRVDPQGATTVTAVEEAPADRPVTPIADEKEALQTALEAARARGHRRAAEILSGSDMMSADEFAEHLGTSRVTVNSKRQSGQLLGLEGAKRGFRFPVWQLNGEGKPFAELSRLHDLLGGAWAVYRFLVQRHAELDGLTGLEALAQGRAKQALAAAESVGRDFS